MTYLLAVPADNLLYLGEKEIELKIPEKDPPELQQHTYSSFFLNYIDRIFHYKNASLRESNLKKKS